MRSTLGAMAGRGIGGGGAALSDEAGDAVDDGRIGKQPVVAQVGRGQQLGARPSFDQPAAGRPRCSRIVPVVDDQQRSPLGLVQHVGDVELRDGQPDRGLDSGIETRLARLLNRSCWPNWSRWLRSSAMGARNTKRSTEVHPKRSVSMVAIAPSEWATTARAGPCTAATESNALPNSAAWLRPGPSAPGSEHPWPGPSNATTRQPLRRIGATKGAIC